MVHSALWKTGVENAPLKKVVNMQLCLQKRMRPLARFIPEKNVNGTDFRPAGSRKRVQRSQQFLLLRSPDGDVRRSLPARRLC